MKLTVITAVHNRIDGLKKVIECLRKQTYHDFEHIIVDDCSEEIDYNGLVKLCEKNPRTHFVRLGFRSHFYGCFARVIGTVLSFCYIHHSKRDIENEWACFPGWTLVETSKGELPIKKIKKGDLVKTHTGKYKKVRNILKRYYKQRSPLIEVSTNFNKIKCTPEHPFFVERSGKKIWINANKIKLSDKLLYPYKDKKDYLFFNCYGNNQNNSLKNSDFFGKYEINKDFAYFLGLYLAEGSHFKDGIGFTFNNNEIEYINFIKKICSEKFGRKITVSKRWSTTFRLNIRSFRKLFISWFGEGAIKKKIPFFVFDWNLINKLSFIKGYVDGDGTSSNKKTKHIVSVSKNLLLQFVKLCRESGLKITDVKKQRKNKGLQMINNISCIANKSWRVHLSLFSYKKIQDLLSANYKKKYLELNIEYIKNKIMYYDGYGGRNQFVYNLEVEDDNSYIANSALVHNCYLDTDNLWKEDHIQSAVDILKDNPNVNLIATDAEWVGVNDKNWKEIRLCRIKQGGCDIGQFFYKTSLFRKYGYWFAHPRRKQKWDYELIKKIYEGEYNEDPEISKVAFTHNPSFILSYRKK
jgi:intein/homing endonuclease